MQTRQRASGAALSRDVPPAEQGCSGNTGTFDRPCIEPRKMYSWMGLGYDHGKLLLIQPKASMQIPFMMLRTPFSGVKSALYERFRKIRKYWEQQPAYSVHFAPQKVPLSAENTYFWTIFLRDLNRIAWSDPGPFLQRNPHPRETPMALSGLRLYNIAAGRCRNKKADQSGWKLIQA